MWKGLTCGVFVCENGWCACIIGGLSFFCWGNGVLGIVVLGREVNFYVKVLKLMSKFIFKLNVKY